MLGKLLHKAMHPPHRPPQHDGTLMADDLDVRVELHYGIPQTASILAFDPVQRLLAIGTLDGRIKIIGDDSIQGLLISPERSPYKVLKFLSNQGFVIGVSNVNDIQIWNLKDQHLETVLVWESNITAFSCIDGTYLMYVGDDEGSISVLKYDDVQKKILKLPYHISAKDFSDAAGISFPGCHSVVGILPQPFTSGNRALIAYDHGVMILWDFYEDRIIRVQGHTSLQSKGEGLKNDPLENLSDNDNEKEICSLCWACKSGSVVAVGYIDGDILFWDFSSKSEKGTIFSDDFVKLQLCSGARRLPVIVLHWSPDTKSNADRGGFLFVYGGDEMGSEEVLTVLHLDWPVGTESLNCVSRVDFTLNGSFADMMLIPENGISEISSTIAAFVLTNPGQLCVYDGSVFLNSEAKEERSAKPISFPVVIPTINPCMTISKLYSVDNNHSYLKVLLEKAPKLGANLSNLSEGTKWPLTGGVPGTAAKDAGIEKILMAGYKDGSIRMWDATYPILTLLLDIEGNSNHLEGFKLSGESSSISALDFCSASLMLATGAESGLVHIYTFKESTPELKLSLLTKDNLEVVSIPQEGTIHCTGIISVANSPVQALDFVHSGDRLAVGLKCGRVLLLEPESLSVLFDMDCSDTEIISLSTEMIQHSSLTSNHSSPKEPRNLASETILILTKDAHIVVADSSTGNMTGRKTVSPKKELTAVSIHIIERTVKQHKSDPLPEFTIKSEPEESSQYTKEKPQVELGGSQDSLNFKESLEDSYLLLCCEDMLFLYRLNSIVEGENKCINEAKLDKACCWSATFKGRTDEVKGVMLLYETGDLEIRSLPSLEVLERSSLMSILRWGYKRNMDRTLSSCGGQISLVNGCELAFISILSHESGFRLPENLPRLHDDVLAAASHAAIGIKSLTKRKQGSANSGFLGGIIKGLKGAKEVDKIIPTDKTNFAQLLEDHFSRVPFRSSSDSIPNDGEKELTIDDIEIDDSPLTASSSQAKPEQKDAKKERERLLDGATTSSKPRKRTPDEIITKYKFGGDATAAAAHARDKLVQRQEKLQRAQERSEELRNHAQDFESLAKELAKEMEKKKFWKF